MYVVSDVMGCFICIVVDGWWWYVDFGNLGIDGECGFGCCNCIVDCFCVCDNVYDYVLGWLMFCLVYVMCENEIVLV